MNARRSSAPAQRPRLAVFKFASCDGCQLSLLDCEDELLAVCSALELAYFPEATSTMLPGPYDIALVEGSITTAHDRERIRQVRRRAKRLVTIGACATSGGIQALRNFRDVAEFTRIVYARPEFIDTLADSTPIAAHVPVDHELRGCPIDPQQLLGLLDALLRGRRPSIPSGSVCAQCKRAGHVCVTVAHAEPCLGPVTQAGCGALCPGFARGCYGCFGPKEAPNTAALASRLEALGLDEPARRRFWQTFNAGAAAFRRAGGG